MSEPAQGDTLRDRAGHEIQKRNTHRIGVVVLAAGASSRMGQSKPLLAIDGELLVVRAARAALESGADPAVFVLGHSGTEIASVLAPLPVTLVHNPNWRTGIGSSLKAGIQIVDKVGVEGAVVALCDQPGLSSSVLTRLMQSFTGPTSLVAARYSGTLGAPAVFGRTYFPELLALPADAGAQRLIKAHAAEVQPVDLPELAVDLDTPADLQRYLARNRETH